MKNIIAKIILLLIIAEGIVVLYFGIMAYFVISVHEEQVFDGLGREVTQSPWLFSLITRQETWPGLKWFIVDTVGFWLAIGVGYVLYQVKEQLEA